MIRLANFIHSTDYWRRGRTLDKLGIENFSVSELRGCFESGKLKLPKEQQQGCEQDV